LNKSGEFVYITNTMILKQTKDLQFSKKINEKRRFETKDIVKRRAVITPDRITIEDYPIKKPLAVFNPSFKIVKSGFKIFARVAFGYYTYACSMIEFDFPFEHMFFNCNHVYKSRLCIIPDNKYDFWGVEDPRYYKLDNMELITYCGRTLGYFDTDTSMEKTLPITALWNGKEWKKIEVYRFPIETRTFVLSDKNAFLFKANEILLFHRLHLNNRKFYLAVSKTAHNLQLRDTIEEIEIKESVFFLEPSGFESKIGWATPPIRIEKEYLVFIHAMNRDQVYRVFSALINEDGFISAVTPFYIMEPRQVYEVYGDRPYVVFPCGAQVWENKIYITYGAADSVIGIGELEIDHLLDILHKNRIY